MNFDAWPWKEIVAGLAALAVALLNFSASKQAGKASRDAKQLGDYLKETTTQMHDSAKLHSENFSATLKIADKLVDRLLRAPD